MGLSHTHKENKMSRSRTFSQGLSHGAEATVASTSETVIFSIATSVADAYELTVTAKDTVTNHVHVAKIIVAHTGSAAVATQYAGTLTDAALASYDVDIDSGNLRLKVTAVSANSTKYIVAASAT